MSRLLLILSAASTAWAQSNLQSSVTVIQNAVIHTVTKGTFQGSIVIRDGRIADVGEKVMNPGGAQFVDAKGRHITPGLIDAHTHIALDSINEGSLSVTAMLGVDEQVNPEQISIYRVLAGGCTTFHTMHGSANSIGGKNIVLKSRWGKDAGDLVFKEAPPTLKFALGENPKRAGSQSSPFAALAGSALRYPGTRMGVEDVIREAFTEARQYQERWKRWQADKKGLPPRRDLKLDTLVEILENKRIPHVHCYRSDEILMSLRVLQEFGIKRATFQHVLEGYKVAKEIAAAGYMASTFSDWWAYKMEALDAIPYNAAIMHKKGVVVSLNSDDAGGSDIGRRLNLEAAKIIRYGGLTEDEALAMVTINPARQLGVEQYVGSIEPGKHADLVFWEKHPLSIQTKVEKVYIDGQVYFDRDQDIAERPKKEARRKGLIEKLREEEKRNAPQMQRRPTTNE
jgi:imidazolonepropionase-like amidohydrolase